MSESNAAWMSHTTLRTDTHQVIACILGKKEKKSTFVCVIHTKLFPILQVVVENLIQRMSYWVNFITLQKNVLQVG